MNRSILIIDNYDSFTYNIVQYIGQLCPNILVYRNDKISLAEVQKLNLMGVIISPGPKKPSEAGISKNVVQHCLDTKLPLLGICLGHQAIGEVLGARVVYSDKVVHGKSCQVHHRRVGILKNIPSPFEAGRYHSLVLERNDKLEKNIKIIAETSDGIIMGIEVKRHPRAWGLQFHPESILTQEGFSIVKNFYSACTS